VTAVVDALLWKMNAHKRDCDGHSDRARFHRQIILIDLNDITQERAVAATAATVKAVAAHWRRRRRQRW
jgi:hypothetical protein